jgi:hypothetical protein
VKVTVDIFVPNINATDGVFIGLRMDQASCTSFIAQGLFFFLLFEDKQIIISRDLGTIECMKFILFEYFIVTPCRSTWFSNFCCDLMLNRFSLRCAYYRTSAVEARMVARIINNLLTELLTQRLVFL